MNRSYCMVLLSLVLVGCAADTRASAALRDGVEDPPALVLWSLQAGATDSIDLSARFAAYPSGVVIYRKARPSSEVPHYRWAQLSREQYEQLLGPARLNALAAIKADYFFVAEATDVPDHILQWRTEKGQVRQILVTGDLEQGDAAPDRRRTPLAYRSLFDALASFDSASARPYVPEAVEVVLTRAPVVENLVPWPTEWPTPLPAGFSSSDPTRERLVAAFPGSRIEEVYRWAWKIQNVDHQLVEYGGKPYFADIRAVLPGNPTVLKRSDSDGLSWFPVNSSDGAP